MTNPVPPITRFKGSHAFLSNFWPVNVSLDKHTYPSVENAYQAARTTDRYHRIPFRDCTAANAKVYGRRLVLRSDWESVKVPIMLDLVMQKFRNFEHLQNLLLDTGSAELIEGNHWGDTFWGVDERKGGANNLGLILMFVRDELRNPATAIWPLYRPK